jgi:hypothetical protein
MPGKGALMASGRHSRRILVPLEYGIIAAMTGYVLDDAYYLADRLIDDTVAAARSDHALPRVGAPRKPAMTRTRVWLFACAATLLLSAPLPARPEEPCCGPITSDGQKLTAFLDASGVDHLWPAGWHVDWQTGQPDRPEAGGRDAKTHCSAFVGAMTVRLGIYILRPPEHPQQLLANAQLRWLAGDSARYGWQSVASASEAQRLANQGMLVVAAFENPDPQKPGHIAIIRPSSKSAAELERDGPQETQAGSTNAINIAVAEGFRHHPGAWSPAGGAIRFYAHQVNWNGAN